MTGRDRIATALVIPAGNGFEEWDYRTSNFDTEGTLRARAPITTNAQWIDSRLFGALAFLNRAPDFQRRLGVGTFRGARRREGTGIENPEAFRVAAVSVALWRNESGNGRAEWNWNAAGIRCIRSVTELCTEPERGGEVLEAFQDFADFCARFFGVLSMPRYARALDAAREGSANALLRLSEAGYSCGEFTAREATGLLRGVYDVAAVDAGLRPAIPADFAATDASLPDRCGGRGNRNVGARSQGSGGLWLLALGAGLVLFSGDK